MSRPIFVFGSNEAGIHGAGAARHAHEHEGARWGHGFGLHGHSFAIPTKDSKLRSLQLRAIQSYVSLFIAIARERPELTFHVTQIGCGLAGFKSYEIAPMFKGAPPNCKFDAAWKPFLRDNESWGSF